MPNYSGVWSLSAQLQAKANLQWPQGPGAPTSVVANGDNQSASVSFTAPTFTGIPPGITGYLATSTPGGFTATGASSPLTVTGLTNGTSYTIAVQATNGVQYGPAGTSNSVTPFNPYFIAVIKPTSGDFYLQGQASYNAITSDGYYIVGGDTSGGKISKISFTGTNTFTNNVTSVNESFQDNTEYFQTINIASSGNIYTGGYAAAGGSATGSYISKFDSSGNSTWTRQLRSFTYDTFGITTDSSENVYFTGGSASSYGSYTSSTRMPVASFDSSGTLRWQVNYGTGTSGFVGFTPVVSGSSVYIVGNNYQNTIFVRRGILVKLSSSTGALEDQKAFDSGSSFQDIVVGNSGALYIAGSQSSPSRVVILKTDGSTRIWASTLQTGYELCKVAVDSSENSYMLTRVSSPNTRNLVIAKFDSSGTIQWQRILNFPDDLFGYQDISVNSAGRILVSTQIRTLNPTQFYPFFAVLSPDGSGTGTYTLDGLTYSYEVANYTISTSSTDFVTPTNTVTTQTRDNFTFYNTPATFSVSIPKTTL